MRNICYIFLAACLILCSCEKNDKQDGLIGWDISFGVRVLNFDPTPGLTSEQIDSICIVIATENEYKRIGSNHVVLHKVTDGKEVKQKAIDFAIAVDERIKEKWGQEVQVDSRYNKLQVVFDADFDTTTETVAIYKYK